MWPCIVPRMRAERHYYTEPLLLPFVFSSIRPAPSSTLFPYTTLFRSQLGARLPRDPATGRVLLVQGGPARILREDRKSTRLNSSHGYISYAVFCLKKKNTNLKLLISPSGFYYLALCSLSPLLLQSICP